MTIHGTVMARNVSNSVRRSGRWSAVRTDPERSPAGGALVLSPDDDPVRDDDVFRGRGPAALAVGTAPLVALEEGTLDALGCGVRFHVACFALWDAERQVPAHEPSGMAGLR